jgi:hypothetical protein
MRLPQRKKVVAASKISGEEDFRTKKITFFKKTEQQ